MEKASGEAAFVDQNSSNGPQKRTTLQITLDGYSGGFRSRAAAEAWAGAGQHVLREEVEPVLNRHGGECWRGTRQHNGRQVTWPTDSFGRGGCFGLGRRLQSRLQSARMPAAYLHTRRAPAPCPPHAAPITAANLLANFQAGLYNNVTLDVTGVSVLAGSQPAGAAGAGGASDGADGADGASDGDAGPVAVRRGARGAPAALPLEILPAGDFEPQYRAALDVRSGELPVLPLSIYGAGGWG